MIPTIILQRSSVTQPHLQHRQVPAQKMQAVSNLRLLVCPEEAGSAHKEHTAVRKNGSKPHFEDVLTPNTAMQWRRKSLPAEQLPERTQIVLVSPLLGKRIKANRIAGGSTSHHACLSGVSHKNIILC